jgi:hypothetical protein
MPDIIAFFQAILRGQSNAVSNMLGAYPELANSTHQIRIAIGNINQVIDGATPLHVALSLENPAIIKALLDHGAPLRYHDASGALAIHWAAALGKTTSLNMVLNHDSSLTTECEVNNHFNLAHNAAVLDQVPTLQSLLQMAPQLLQGRDISGHTPALLAAKGRKLGCLKEIITHIKSTTALSNPDFVRGALFTKDHSNESPLTWACYWGFHEEAIALMKLAKATFTESEWLPILKEKVKIGDKMLSPLDNVTLMHPGLKTNAALHKQTIAHKKTLLKFLGNNPEMKNNSGSHIYSEREMKLALESDNEHAFGETVRDILAEY